MYFIHFTNVVPMFSIDVLYYVSIVRGGYDSNWISFTTKPRSNQLQYSELVQFDFDKSYGENQTKPIEHVLVWLIWA